MCPETSVSNCVTSQNSAAVIFYFVITNWYNKHGQHPNKIYPRNTKIIYTIAGFAEQICSRSLLAASTCRTEPRDSKITRKAQRVVQTNIHWKMVLRSLAICQHSLANCTRLLALCCLSRLLFCFAFRFFFF